MTVEIAHGSTRTHLVVGVSRRLTACGLWRLRYDSTIRSGATADVNCGRCRRTAQFVVAEREEKGAKK